MKILLIDDEESICTAMENYLLEIEPFDIDKAFDGKEALNKIKNNRYDLIISDIYLPEINGIDLVKIYRQYNPKARFILISGKSEVLESIASLDYGVFDFLTKPIDLLKLTQIIFEVKEKEKMNKKPFDLMDSKSVKSKNNFISLRQTAPENIIYFNNSKYVVAASTEMKTIIKKIQKIYEYPDITVLIEGKTGTGKEIVAEYLHFCKGETQAPFVGLNCSAISRTIFESELFGYEKGSFTGADPKGKIGKIKSATGGILFLDEISEMPIELQTKLLRVLEEKEYYPLGSNKKQKVNDRIACATNKDIPELIQKGLFREDLFYRINICKITLPSLAQRKEDILPLLAAFVNEFNTKNNTEIGEITKDSLDFLHNFDWPGNIRQLKNAVTKAMLFNEKKYLSIEDFDFLSKEIKDKQLVIDPNNPIILNNPFNLIDFTQKIIAAALQKFQGNKTKAAQFLGLSRMQMYNRFKPDKDIMEKF